MANKRKRDPSIGTYWQMAPYEQGWEALEMGKRIQDCLYPKASGEAIAWRNGYRDHAASLGISA